MKQRAIAITFVLLLTMSSAAHAEVKSVEVQAPPAVVDDRAADSPPVIAPILQQAYLKASNTGVRDHFGWSVAIDGDTAVVGAPDEDSRATNSGAAYVFARKDGVWIQEAFLVGTGGDME